MKRTERIDLRVTPDEKNKIAAASAAAGMTMTAYLLFRIGEIAGEALADKIIKKEAKK